VLEVFQIQERNDIQPGGAVIETEGGIINAQISNQLQVLERAFKKLFSSKERAL
jgi:type III secretion protein L